jgi:hypothetical protein
MKYRIKPYDDYSKTKAWALSLPNGVTPRPALGHNIQRIPRTFPVSNSGHYTKCTSAQCRAFDACSWASVNRGFKSQ